MKRFLKLFFVLLVTAHTPGIAQDEPPVKPTVARWVPKAGYWVAENNAQQPKLYTIYFYNNENILVYKESIEGITLNLDSRKVKMRLKKVLETSLLAWQKQHEAKENEGLVINLLQGK